MASVEVYQYAVNPITIEGQEGTATQAYKDGDLVKWEAAGRFIIGTAASFTAIARKDATGTAATKGSYELISPDNLYVMKAVSTTATLQTDVGSRFSTTFTLGAHVITAEASSNIDGIIVGLHPADGPKTGGRYIVRFLSTVVDGMYA
jgi:hypothetical protein